MARNRASGLPRGRWSRRHRVSPGRERHGHRFVAGDADSIVATRDRAGEQEISGPTFGGDSKLARVDVALVAGRGPGSETIWPSALHQTDRPFVVRSQPARLPSPDSFRRLDFASTESRRQKHRIYRRRDRSLVGNGAHSRMAGRRWSRNHGVCGDKILAYGRPWLVGARPCLVAFSRERDLHAFRVVDASSIAIAQVLASLKLSFGHAFNIWRSAPRGHRFELLRKIRCVLRDASPASSARYFDVGEFGSWEQFEIKYRQLA